MNNKQRTRNYSSNFLKLLFVVFAFFSTSQTYAACAGTTRTWQGTNGNWNQGSNWDTGNQPNTPGEDAVVTNTGNLNARTKTIGCMTINGGQLRSNGLTGTLTITGDQFYAPNTNTVNMANADDFEIDMAGNGSNNQTLTVVDNLDFLTISNNNIVTIDSPTRIRGTLAFTGSGTTFKINGAGDLRMDQDVTIPSGVTVEINNGATWYARNITLDGVLKVNAGGTLKMLNGRTITVSSTGVLQLNGSDGNIATLRSDGDNRYFYLNLSGNMSAEYFTINGLRNAGINSTGGTISKMQNGEFHNGRTNVDYITLDASSTIPATMDNLGFYDDYGYGNLININANAYSGSSTNLDNYAGSAAGPTYEADANNTIDWGTEASTVLNMTNRTNSGDPGAYTRPNEGYLTYAIFEMSLSQSDTATNITEVTVTADGTAQASDIEGIELYQDINGNCNYNAATDTQIGTTQVPSGSPASVTFSSIATGIIQTDGTSNTSCFFILAKISDSAVDARTLRLGIAGSADITNDQGYSFSGISAPPMYGNMTFIDNNILSEWDGSVSDVWTVNGNWTGQAPTLANGRNCQIGTGINDTRISADPVYCGTALLLSSGTVDWNNTANELRITGSLSVESGHTFANATAGPGIIRMESSTNVSLDMDQSFPGNMIIDNSGGPGSETVSVVGNSYLGGDLTLTNGILSIGSGATLHVDGDIVVQTGATLSVSAGGTLNMGDATTLTVDSGGTLNFIGNTGTKAMITADGTDSWSATISGNIAARYYTVSHTNASGFVIGSGATIDATYNLTDGSFIHPLGASPLMLVLNQEIPGDSIDNMVFDDDGSGYTGTATNIDTSSIAVSSDTLAIPNYSGNLTGTALSNDPNYEVDWQNETNTLKVTNITNPSVTLDAGSTYVMGNLQFQQSQAGTFNDTDITALTITLTGTGSSSDVTEARAYYDSDCNDTGGTLLETGTFSGAPSTWNLTFAASELTVAADAVTPPTVCLYIEFDIAGAAVGGNTLGFKINSAPDITNSEGYELDSSTSAPIFTTFGTIAASTTTIWTGATSTDFTVAGNWTSGVPDKDKDCEIGSASNNPILSSGTEACKSVNITNGNLTISGGAILEVYQNFTNTGTLASSGTLRMEDDGSAGTHTISSSSPLNELTFDMPTASTVSLSGSNLTITNLTIPASQGMTLNVNAGMTLTLTNGVNIQSGTFDIDAGATVELASGQSITVSGGTFSTSGVSDLDISDPDNVTQSTANKGKVAVSGGVGTWGFSATSGTVSLTGFLFESMNTSGLNISGSANLTVLNGGQFTKLSTSYASLTAIQISTTGTVTASATNIGWQWDSVPANTEPYTLVSTSGSGCSSGTITFTNFFGNWYEDTNTFDVETKNTDNNCTVTFGGSASPVVLISFTAEGYDNAVDLKWETSYESNHFGFNVYRSDAEQAGFIQVNSELIMNQQNNGSHRGKYRFVDNDVQNGEVYYYYIEDVSLSHSERELHGPRSVTPLSSNGNPPADDPDENSGSNPGGGGSTTDPGSIANPSFKDLGNGIAILSQTSTNLRIQIEPATPTFSASSWNAAYEDIAIPSYAKTTTAGHPELLEREILVEVYRYATTASTSVITTTESNTAGHNITPAPLWSTDANGQLVSSYAEDASVYTTNAYTGNSYYSLTSNLITVGERKFLKLKVSPIQYNPVTDDVKYLTKLILDVNLDGNDWDQTLPSDQYEIVPEIVANNLKIQVTQTGLYELSFDDLVDSNVEGPFSGEDIADLRLYRKNQEISLEIIDADGTFNSGDRLRFYVDFEESLEDITNTLILTTLDFGNGDVPLRFGITDGDPAGENATSELTMEQTVVAEENWMFLTAESMKDDGDHFLWNEIFNFPGRDNHDFTVNLPNLDPTAEDTIKVYLTLKGRKGYIGSQDVTHHIGLFVNDMTNWAGNVVFSDDTRETYELDVDANFFVAGNNSIRLKALGTFAPSNDYDRVYIDKVEFKYTSTFNTPGASLSFSNSEQDTVSTITGFSSSQILVYDVTEHSNILTVQNTNISTPDADASYNIEFFTNSDDLEEQGSRYYLTLESAIMTPHYLSLTSEYEGPLRDTDLQADLLVIGHRSLLNAAEDLIVERSSQGLEVKTIEPEQIYAEFSHGQVSSQALNDFINYALSNWQKPSPRYLLILGDGTFDPKDYNLDSLAEVNRSALYYSTLPVWARTGEFFDFASDSDYVAGSSHLPQIVVGRIPTNSPTELETYIEKVLTYEAGSLAPENPKSVAFFQDTDINLGDRFQEKGDQLASLESLGSAGMDIEKHHRDLTTAVEFESAITSQFELGTHHLNLFGHGAYNVWGNDGFFNLNFAENLTNSKLPIVMSLSCENAAYYDDDIREITLGEKLIFNQNGGAVLFIGATSQTKPESQMSLALAYYQELARVSKLPVQDIRVGDILHRAKQTLGTNHSHKDIVRAVHVIGDPTLSFPEDFFTPAIELPTSTRQGGPVVAKGCTAFAADDPRAPSPWEFLLEIFVLMGISMGIKYLFEKGRRAWPFSS